MNYAYIYNCKVEYVPFVDLISTEKYIFIGHLLLLMLAWGFMKLIIGQDSKARFGQDLEVYNQSKCWCLVEILKLDLVEILKMKFV